MKKLFVALFLFAVLLMACEPKIDYTNEETLKKSTVKILKSLPDDKKELFVKNLTGIILIISLANLSGSDEDKEAQIKKTIHNKSAKDIFEIAERMGEKLKR